MLAVDLFLYATKLKLRDDELGRLVDGTPQCRVLVGALGLPPLPTLGLTYPHGEKQLKAPCSAP